MEKTLYVIICATRFNAVSSTLGVFDSEDAARKGWHVFSMRQGWGGETPDGVLWTVAPFKLNQIDKRLTLAVPPLLNGAEG